MLKEFFKQGDFLARLQSNPLHAYLDTFATSLVGDAYAAATVRSKVSFRQSCVDLQIKSAMIHGRGTAAPQKY